ncbi:MAG: thioredoxin family protein [Nanoarchaeota archaeon]
MKIQQTMGIAATIMLLALMMTACSSDTDSSRSDENESIPDTITIQGDGTLPKEFCERHGLDSKILMLESEYCSHCKATRPDFEQALENTGTEAEILDVSVKEDQERITEKYGLEIQYTPTFVFGCDYFVGVKTVDEYETLLEKTQQEGD